MNKRKKKQVSKVESIAKSNEYRNADVVPKTNRRNRPEQPHRKRGAALFNDVWYHTIAWSWSRKRIYNNMTFAFHIFMTNQYMYVCEVRINWWRLWWLNSPQETWWFWVRQPLKYFLINLVTTVASIGTKINKNICTRTSSTSFNIKNNEAVGTAPLGTHVYSIQY